MDQRLHDLHLRAGQLSGRAKTCGRKTPYASEALAQKAAEAHNHWTGRRHDVESYPCAFCHQWHVGGVMPLPLLEAMATAAAAAPADPADAEHQAEPGTRQTAAARTISRGS